MRRPPAGHRVQHGQGGLRQAEALGDLIEVRVEILDMADEVRQASFCKTQLHMLRQEVALGDRVRCVGCVQPPAVVAEAGGLGQPVNILEQLPALLLLALTLSAFRVARMRGMQFRVEGQRPRERVPDESEAVVAARLRAQREQLGGARLAEQLGVRRDLEQRRHDAPRSDLGIAQPDIAVFPGNDLLGPKVGRTGRRAGHAPSRGEPPPQQCASHVPSDGRQ